MALGFTMPIDGRITSPFGIRSAPTAGATTKHEGIDIAAAVGTPVKAALSGIVSKTGYSSAQGNYIHVDHGGGLETVYKHLSQGTLGLGAKVNEGQIIAKSGNTGVSTGAHLEFQILKNGVAIDPMSFTRDSAAYQSVGAGLNLSGFSLSGINADGLLEVIKKYWWIIAGGLVVADILK